VTNCSCVNTMRRGGFPVLVATLRPLPGDCLAVVFKPCCCRLGAVISRDAPSCCMPRMSADCKACLSCCESVTRSRSLLFLFMSLLPLLLLLLLPG
jgi:hypothetical protein